MPLPDDLSHAINQEIENYSLSDILEARIGLTERYRKIDFIKETFMLSDADRIAYIATRMPATVAAISHVLQELTNHFQEGSIRSLLDLGAGPGSVMWAAAHVGFNFEKATLFEQDRSLMAIGKRLAAQSTSPFIQLARWEYQNLETLTELPAHDLIVLSYAIGELRPEKIESLIEQSWRATNHSLVIIEPGTPGGFERIAQVRDQLIALGAYMVAPCPHTLSCPMKNGDWCHFSERVERTSLHRKLKEGTLGYEDEKFSYLIFSKYQTPLPYARILRHPVKHSGHVCLELCCSDGLKAETISKRDKEHYKEVRKAKWGSHLTQKRFSDV